jgi:hypothetical protein
MSHFVRLEVVPDAEDERLCGKECGHADGGPGCTLRAWEKRASSVTLSRPGVDFRRTDFCVNGTALDEKERAVIEAAMRWNATGERTLEQAEALCTELETAIDALSALRDEGKSDDP